jgi:hypothetical protein
MAVPVVEYPIAQVTLIAKFVFAVGADGVVPSGAAVAGQGWSMQVGNSHVSSSLQVAVSDVDHPVAQVTSMPVPVGDSGAKGVVVLATVAGQGSSLQMGSVHVLSALQVAVSDVENPVAQVTGIPVPVDDVGADGVFPVASTVAGQ